MAFLINAYNAFTVELILTKYPDLKSIKDLGSLFSSPWKIEFFTPARREAPPGLDRTRAAAPEVRGAARARGGQLRVHRLPGAARRGLHRGQARSPARRRHAPLHGRPHAQPRQGRRGARSARSSSGSARTSRRAIAASTSVEDVFAAYATAADRRAGRAGQAARNGRCRSTTSTTTGRSTWSADEARAAGRAGGGGPGRRAGGVGRPGTALGDAAVARSRAAQADLAADPVRPRRHRRPARAAHRSDGSYGNLVHAGATAAARCRWRWRLDRPLAGADLRRKSGDDTALKVCAMFDLPLKALSLAERRRCELARAVAGEPLPAATLCYVWDPSLPAGTQLPNAYTPRLRWWVLRGPETPLQTWQAETRDLSADFLRAFGGDTRPCRRWSPSVSAPMPTTPAARAWATSPTCAWRRDAAAAGRRRPCPCARAAQPGAATAARRRGDAGHAVRAPDVLGHGARPGGRPLRAPTTA